MSEGYTISKDLIEDKYIPSPDLVAEYQENCAKTSSSQPMVENIQVKTIYGDKSVKNNTLKPYQRIIPPKGVLIEEKEENILDNLKNLKIDATQLGGFEEEGSVGGGNIRKVLPRSTPLLRQSLGS